VFDEKTVRPVCAASPLTVTCAPFVTISSPNVALPGSAKVIIEDVTKTAAVRDAAVMLRRKFLLLITFSFKILRDSSKVLLNSCFFVHEYRVNVNKYLTRIDDILSASSRLKENFDMNFIALALNCKSFFAKIGDATNFI
jgi:hypothetical protein